MINYEEVARDLYALGSWPIVGILIAVLAYLRNTSLIIELIIALGIAFIITTLLNPDERIVRMIIVLTTVGLLAGTVRGWIITAIIAAAALTLSARYLNRYDVTRSALIGMLVQGLAFFVASFI